MFWCIQEDIMRFSSQTDVNKKYTLLILKKIKMRDGVVGRRMGCIPNFYPHSPIQIIQIKRSIHMYRGSTLLL